MKQLILLNCLVFFLLSCDNRGGNTGTVDTVTTTINTSTNTTAPTDMPATGNGMGRATTGPDTLAKNIIPGSGTGQE